MSIDIAHYHHENWDGSGYPSGRKEDKIPLSAQIVAVAGAFCALTESRVYRESYQTEEAISMLQKETGKKYNQNIINIIRKYTDSCNSNEK